MLTNNLISWFKAIGLSNSYSRNIADFMILIFIILLSYIIMKIFRSIFLKWIQVFIKRSQNKWDDIFLFHNLPQRISLIIPGVLIYFAASNIFSKGNIHLLYLISLVCKIYLISVFVLIINSVIAAIRHIYEELDTTGQAPVKSVLQMIKLIVFLIAVIVIISLLIKQSPWTLLKAMGALAAVGMLVFKDPILGLVAGIQLSAQRMLRKGDWIEMPHFGANGDVIDVSLTTVKVQNFDKTIVCIPTYALVSNSFQNWRGMTESGGRRIKRSINLDINSFKFLSSENIEKLKKVEYLTDYLGKKEKDIATYNSRRKSNENIINGRRLTNVGTYRFYIKEYLRKHSKIHNNMTFIVRQLQPTEKGLPLEVYVFTNDTSWVNYEEIQADIFDHLLTIIPEFELSIYQAPSGNDFREAFKVN